MFGLFKKSIRSMGVVLFKGGVMPRPAEFAFLADLGVTMRQEPKDAAETGVHWSVRLEHPAWGAARLLLPTWPVVPPDGLIEPGVFMTPGEAAEAKMGARGVALFTDGAGDVLRDRKNFYRWTRAVMGDDGVTMCDNAARRWWSPAALDDELAHDALLDPEAIFSIAADWGDPAPGSDERGNPRCARTIGLASVGAFDLDIIGPHEDMFDNDLPILRAIAFAVLEGTATSSTRGLRFANPGGITDLVPLPRFRREADPAFAAILADEGDDDSRAVLCDPAGDGLVARLVRSKKPRPLRYMSSPPAQGTVVSFSAEASAMMADRARATAARFVALVREFRPLGLPALAKVAFPDGRPGSHEHLWFEIDPGESEKLSGTLLNQPYYYTAITKGDRVDLPMDQLSDWMIQSPVGTITPRTQTVARRIRQTPKLQEALRAIAAEPDEDEP